MSCGKCKSPVCNKGNLCTQRLRIGWVPESSCTLFYEQDGIGATLDMSQVHACAPATHLRWNDEKCRIEYLNEDYVLSNGTRGAIEFISAKTIASCIELEDLANVIDKNPNNCDLLVWKSGECGPGCTGPGTGWQAYTPPKVEELSYVAGFGEDGCLQKLNDPSSPGTDPEGTNMSCYFLIHSGNTSSWVKPAIGTVAHNLGVDINGCPVLEQVCNVNKVLRLPDANLTGNVRPGVNASVPGDEFAGNGRRIKQGDYSYTNTSSCPVEIVFTADFSNCVTPPTSGTYELILGAYGKITSGPVTFISGLTEEYKELLHMHSNVQPPRGIATGSGQVSWIMKLNPAETVNFEFGATAFLGLGSSSDFGPFSVTVGTGFGGATLGQGGSTVQVINPTIQIRTVE